MSMSMRGVSSDRGGVDGAIIVRMSWISETEVTSYGAALAPPEARLATSPFLSGGTHITGTIVGAGARSRLGCSILKSVHHSVKAVSAGWDDHCSVPAHMGEEAGKYGEEGEGCCKNNPWKHFDQLVRQ